MSILIVGGSGNMGQRYQAVLHSLGVPYRVADIDNSEDYIAVMAQCSTGVIIATPTDTHAAIIRVCTPAKKPILCEKPVTKDIAELEALVAELRSHGTPFNMVYQYAELVDPLTSGVTGYDYFRHGNDGLAWDCIQIIGLAKSEVILREESPIWRCSINGAPLSIADMDRAYLSMISRWLKKPGQDLNDILAIHRKTDEMAKRLHS